MLNKNCGIVYDLSALTEDILAQPDVITPIVDGRLPVPLKYELSLLRDACAALLSVRSSDYFLQFTNANVPSRFDIQGFSAAFGVDWGRAIEASQIARRLHDSEETEIVWLPADEIINVMQSFAR